MIRVASSAGFCFGVARAVNMLEDMLDKGQRVCTLGPIIHNPNFIEQLRQRGVLTVGEPDEVPEDYTLVVRTHGIPKQVRQQLIQRGTSFIDATCPFVAKIQSIVDEETRNNAVALIAGDSQHPEVQAIKSYCHGEAFTFNSDEELDEILQKNDNFSKKEVIFVSQTTFSVKEYKKCEKKLNSLCTNLKKFDTICSATSKRQREAFDLSQSSDAVIVVGGRNSSNTEKLYCVCRDNCPSYLIETADELRSIDFSEVRNVGITAGASTPDSIIKEVRNTMSEIIKENETMEAAVVDAVATEKDLDAMSFEDALEESLKTMSSDQKVVGEVIRILPNEIQVDIVGRKQTGIIPIEEYSADPSADPAAELKAGDMVTCIIMKTNDNEGTILLSKRRYDAGKNWDSIVAAKDSAEVLTGKVVEIKEKGVLVLTNGIRVFVPASHATLNRVENIDEALKALAGQEVSFRIIDIDTRRRRAVGSIRDVARAARKEAAEKFWAEVEIGKKYTGTVKSLTSFAAFVDLGGADGMVHRSELSWRRIKHPSDVVSIGDEVEVFVKDVDKEKKKVSLGYKKIEDNPWEILKRDYPVDTVCDVEIVGLTTFGAFGRIIPGIDGLIHISQIADRRIAQPGEVLAVGDVVKAKITEIDFEKKRISLSIRALIEKKEEPVAEVEEPVIDEAPVAVPIEVLLANAQAEAEAQAQATEE